MSHTRNREEELAAEITRLKQERPYLDNLFTSFGPMLLLRERWMKDKTEGGNDHFRRSAAIFRRDYTDTAMPGSSR